MPKPVAPPPWTKPFYVGVDENGMGPRLGPMIVTAVAASTDPRGARVATSKPRGNVAKRIGDSKGLVAYDDSALGEAWARALVARRHGAAKTPTELLAALSLDDADTLRAPCPGHHPELCWGDEGETFTATEEAVVQCERDLAYLEARGLRVERARVGIVCTRKLNDAVAAGLSRFDLDLHTMERLVLAAREDAGDEVYAVCGKVGGFDFYGARFGPLSGYLHTMLVEGRARSEYHVPGVGRLAFVRDADEGSLIVGLASLVGKWVRDHLMRRVVRYHRNDVPELPDASGYHDPVTTRFIDASALVRKARRVEAACFERDALGRKASVTSSAPKPKRKAPGSQASLLPSEEA